MNNSDNKFYDFEFIKNPSFEKMPECLSHIIRKINDIELAYKTKLQEEQFLDMKSAADFLHLSVSRLYTLCQKRNVPYIKMGKRLLFVKADLINFMKSKRVEVLQTAKIMAGKEGK